MAIARVAPPLTAAAFVLLWREPIAYSVPAASRALDHRSESHYAAAMIADARLKALSVAVGEKLRESGLRIVTAESCTGGWIGKVLTDISGSSTWYLGGAVVYSNQLKESLLNVRAATLADHGAVSESTAREMAAGALERLGGDIAVAVTGIAGPDGGTPQKPVGTVWFAWAVRSGETASVHVRHQVFGGDRDNVRRATVEFALTEVMRLVEQR